MAGEEATGFQLEIADEAAMRQLGSDLAMALGKGGIVHLAGELGAGKSVLARAMIRQLMDDPELEVPSPTFSLVQSYEPRRGPALILHADLYRIGDPSECLELGLADAADAALLLIEWPERAGNELAPPDLAITISESGNAPAGHRRIAIRGNEDALGRIGRSIAIRAFLDENWGKGVVRAPLQGDASARSYETVALGGETRILMNAPRQADGPPVRDGLPYSRIAHLAEDVTAFVGVQTLLSGAGFAVPRLYAADLQQGILLLEHLGSGQIIDTNRKPIAGRYLACAQMLAQFHCGPVPDPAEPGAATSYRIPGYDRGAMLIEAELLTDWYAPRLRGGPLPAEERQAFLDIWNALIDRLGSAEQHLCLRDFHSPNVIWRDGMSGSDRVGLIDFQDAVIGPSAYDLASLAQDARVDIPVQLEQELIEHYCGQREARGPFDRRTFLDAYAIMAAQRASKILGIFVRLDERDGKPGYLAHLPRLQDYLKRSLVHPVLADYAAWLDRVIGPGGAALPGGTKGTGTLSRA